MIALVRNGKPVRIGNFLKRPRSRELPPNLPHDPMPSCYLPEVMSDLARLCLVGCERAYENAANFLSRQSGWGTTINSSEDLIFLRAPRIRYKRAFAMSCQLTWVYDGHELTLAFNADTKTGAILDGRRVSEEEAVEAVIAWNQVVIRGEARRIREAREAELKCIPSLDDPGDDDEWL